MNFTRMGNSFWFFRNDVSPIRSSIKTSTSSFRLFPFKNPLDTLVSEPGTPEIIQASPQLERGEKSNPRVVLILFPPHIFSLKTGLNLNGYNVFIRILS